MNISDVINQLVDEKDLDPEVLAGIVCEGMLLAYEKKYPDLELRVNLDKEAGALVVQVNKEVVSSVSDADKEISLRKARAISSRLKVGSKTWLDFDGEIGRVEVLRARQAIANKIKGLESLAVWESFKDKEGTIVHGSVHKLSRGGVLVKIQDTMAFLPSSLSIPTETYTPGYPVKALLKEVLEEPRGENQLILDRASEGFLKQLFELEVPEIFDGLVEIKKIVRIPGYKSKVAVTSHDSNIDPVGTCVGVGGARIKPILKELDSEKIDIVQWSNMQERFVSDSLKPAKVNRVEMLDDVAAKVWLDEDQRSVAIGKMGQNIALASRLTGVNINIAENSGDASLEV